jgi:hypothetical protein
MKVIIEQEHYDVVRHQKIVRRSTIEDSSNDQNLDDVVQLCEQAIRGLGYHSHNLETTHDSA